MLVGIGSGDSRMETAAVDGILGLAEEEPLTMTCRFVDLRAERRFEGGAEEVSRAWLLSTRGRLTLASDSDSLVPEVDIVSLNTCILDSYMYSEG